jgi:hypothetical protein
MYSQEAIMKSAYGSPVTHQENAIAVNAAQSSDGTDTFTQAENERAVPETQTAAPRRRRRRTPTEGRRPPVRDYYS